MASEGKGIVGSLAVHLGIIAVLVGASWFVAKHDGASVEPADPLLVVLNGIPGRRPGEVGKAAGVAQGSESGTKSGVRRVQLPKLDLEKIQQDRAAAEMAATAERTAPSTRPKKLTKTGASKPGVSSKQTSLSDFQKSQGGGKGPAKAGGIGGVQVGRKNGPGDNGGDGGSATEKQLYAGEVLARFRLAWSDIIAAEGAALSAADNCGVTVSVDFAGNVAFAGWLTKPKDARMAELVRRACVQIGNCGKPPAGKSFNIDFPKVNVSDS